MKVSFFMRKRPDRSLDQFSNYWRENHGPYAMSGRTDRLGMLRYVQNHMITTPLSDALAHRVGAGVPPFEGVCQIWFESEDAILRTRSSADGTRATGDLVNDELNFLDLRQSEIRFYREEHCIDGIAGSGAQKLILGLKMSDPGRAEGLGHDVGDILAGVQDEDRHIARAVHNFGLDTPANEKLRAPRGNDRDAFDYFLELWFRDYAALARAVHEPAGVLQAIVKSVRAYQRGNEVAAWIAQERIMIGGEARMRAAA